MFVPETALSAEYVAPVRWGHTIAEQVENATWKGEGSAPSWIIGEGHLSIAEARTRALDLVQIALEVEGHDDTYWPDIESDVRDRRCWEYDLVRPGWDIDIVSALVLDADG